MGSPDNSLPLGRAVSVSGLGEVLFPNQFEVFTAPLGPAELHDAREAPKEILARLASGAAVILTGPYSYVDAIYRYCARNESSLLEPQECVRIADRAQRSAALVQARRRKLHHLLVAMRGEELLNVEGAPEIAGLQEWLEQPIAGRPFLIPVRRLQRILTDMRRAREGLRFKFLDAPITILPHVYVPGDQSVPAMFLEYAPFFPGRRVLDVGTGTGILALLAARLGAARVVATDCNPCAVRNARLNVERLGLKRLVDVREPGDLYEPVAGEVFDVIVFNAPWIQGAPRTLYDTANYDPGFRVLDGFVRGAPRHLAEGGRVLLQYSNLSQRSGASALDHLREVLADNSLEITSRRCISRMSRVLGAQERVFLFEIRQR